MNATNPHTRGTDEVDWHSRDTAAGRLGLGKHGVLANKQNKKTMVIL